jgi:N-acyl-L-homoserine lactone synthetase
VGVRIKIAQTAKELDALFALRHRVFVEEGYMAPTHDGRITDRFDAFPTTANIIALVEGEVIGGVRYMRRCEVGSSVEEFFDPTSFAPPGARLAVGSLLVLDPRFRGVPRITFNMAAMGFYWGKSEGLTHIIGVVNPDREEGFLKSGFQRLGPTIASRRIQKVAVQPMIADINALGDRFMAFLVRQDVAHWLHSFEREFHSAGELVVRQGESGSAAYVIVSGRAVVLDANGQTVATLEQGDLFGEIALLSNVPRTATVRAETDLDLMVVERAAVRAQLRDNPRAVEMMLELLANRLETTIRRTSAPPPAMMSP